MRSLSLFVVLSSPSGGGKTTICWKLLARHRNFGFSVSATTRPKRPGERHRRDYYFMSSSDFERKRKQGAFVEWAQVYGACYGTLRREVENLARRFPVVLFDVDTRGGLAIKGQYPHTALVFLLPPSSAAQRRRLARRGTDDRATQKARLAASRRELARMSKYDYVVTNERLGQTIRAIESIITAERLKVVPTTPRTQ